MKRLMESLRSENYSSWAERIGEMQVAPVLNIITISTMQRSKSSPQILVMIREWNADLEEISRYFSHHRIIIIMILMIRRRACGE